MNVCRLAGRLPPTGRPHHPGRRARTPTSMVTGESDSVVLPMRAAVRVSVPVVLEGRRGQDVEVSMIFDTGATLTTLDQASDCSVWMCVRCAGSSFQTQTGADLCARDARSDVARWIARRRDHGGVCEPCSNDDDVGLLGLNVSRRFWSRWIRQGRNWCFSRGEPVRRAETFALGGGGQHCDPVAGWSDGGRSSVQPRASPGGLGRCRNLRRPLHGPRGGHRYRWNRHRTSVPATRNIVRWIHRGRDRWSLGQ